MAQETRNVDYESMVNKCMNEWEGSNLREFCFSEKVNIYRMMKGDTDYVAILPCNYVAQEHEDELKVKECA